MKRLLGIVIVLTSVVLKTGVALSAVDICVESDTNIKESEGFAKLVLSEIARHPSHHVVDDECKSHLKVELFKVEGKRYLTARIGKEVPVRFVVKGDDELQEKLKEAISLALGNDPVHLAKDISHYNLVQRASHSILKRGNNRFRLELFQTLSRGDGALLFAPGGAFAITRGSGHWQVMARIHLAGWPGNVGQTERVLRVFTGADAGIAYEFSALANSTFYTGGGAGLHYMRYEGRLVASDPDTFDYINQLGVSLFLRAGVRLLRLYDFDCDLFVTGYLPLFKTFGEDSLYTPSVQIGVGVGF
ncbi:MAG: hypothetical protein GY847_32340 [Proteobacteria bacterium]|nr:hypothetical protein [Pseudomonadota bacterium]